MPAPGSGTGAIGQMKKMRFPGTPPPEATTLATTPAPQTPPLTTPDPLSSVDILLTPERDFKPGILLIFLPAVLHQHLLLKGVGHFFR